MALHPGSRDGLRDGWFQISFLVWPDVLRDAMTNGNWLPGVDSHHDDPLNRRTCSFDITGE
jgi:hypothetical protein